MAEKKLQESGQPGENPFEYQEINISGSTEAEVEQSYQEELARYNEYVERAKDEFSLSPLIEEHNEPEPHGLSGVLQMRKRAIEEARRNALKALKRK